MISVSENVLLEQGVFFYKIRYGPSYVSTLAIFFYEAQLDQLP
jgi:hypothetical protein